MKNLILSLLLFIAIPMATFTGCSTTSQVQTAQTILAVQTAVDNIMKSYADAVAIGSVSLEDRVKAREQYRSYEALENKVITGLAFGTDLNEVSDAELADLAFELTIFLLTLLD